MLESFLKILNGEKTDEVVWTADITYWIDAQPQIVNIFKKRNTEEGYLQFCKELGTMPYYWYGPEGCWFGDEIWLAKPQYKDTELFAKVDGDEQQSIFKTPIGQLEQRLSFSKQTCSAAFTKYFVENKEDLKVLVYILEHRCLVLSEIANGYKKRAALWKRYDGIPSVALPRSPLSALFTEWIGVENGTYLIFDCKELVTEILNLLEEQEKPILDAVCEIAPEVVHFTDNLNSETYTGFFDEFMAPRYKRRLEQLHSANVKAAVHLDGTVRGLLPKLAEVGFDAVEALTPKPAGDLEVEQMRPVCENKNVVLWGGVPGVLFPQRHCEWDKMKEHVEKVLDAWQGQPFVLGVADQVPPDGDITRVKKISDLVRSWKG